MNHHRPEQRRAAAKAFLESLDQMASCFQSDTQAAIEAEPATSAGSDKSAELNFAALEAAIADIEQFMQQRQS